MKDWITREGRMAPFRQPVRPALAWTVWALLLLSLVLDVWGG